MKKKLFTAFGILLVFAPLFLIEITEARGGRGGHGRGGRGGHGHWRGGGRSWRGGGFNWGVSIGGPAWYGGYWGSPYWRRPQEVIITTESSSTSRDIDNLEARLESERDYIREQKNRLETASRIQRNKIRNQIRNAEQRAERLQSRIDELYDLL